MCCVHTRIKVVPTGEISSMFAATANTPGITDKYRVFHWAETLTQWKNS